MKALFLPNSSYSQEDKWPSLFQLWW